MAASAAQGADWHAGFCVGLLGGAMLSMLCLFRPILQHRTCEAEAFDALACMAIYVSLGKALCKV